MPRLPLEHRFGCWLTLDRRVPINYVSPPLTALDSMFSTSFMAPPRVNSPFVARVNGSNIRAPWDAHGSGGEKGLTMTCASGAKCLPSRNLNSGAIPARHLRLGMCLGLRSVALGDCTRLAIS